MIDWKEIWNRKGMLNTNDLLVLNGGEHTQVKPPILASHITHILKISSTDLILEIGCGAGMIAQHLNCRYIGLDYAFSLATKHKRILGNPLCCGEANRLPFPDKTFDKVFAHSVFHYFPDHAYAEEALTEMRRVAKKAIFVGDLPIHSHRPNEHLLFIKKQFRSWEISAGFFNVDRFNAYQTLEDSAQ